MLFDADKVDVVHAPGGDANKKSNPPFDGVYTIDTDDDRIEEIYSHYRPPLEAKVTVKATNQEFFVIVVHTKSKGIFNSVDMVHWERENRRNRLKLFAECTWVRNRVDEWLSAGRRVLVMGDVNDGPGMDYFEMTYGRSAVETIMGDLFEPRHVLQNHAGKPKWTANGWKPASARFTDRITHDPVNVLIDHILVSQDLPLVDDKSHQIWNPYENDAAKPLRKDLKAASDHFPVTVDLNV